MKTELLQHQKKKGMEMIKQLMDYIRIDLILNYIQQEIGIEDYHEAFSIYLSNEWGDFLSLSGEPNRNFKVRLRSPKEKINLLVCQDCGCELIPEEGDIEEGRKTALCPECYDKMEKENNIED